MTTQEFYHFAVIAAKNRGYDKPRITTMSGCYEGNIKHSCQLFILEKRKFVSALDFEKLTYSKETENIELEWWIASQSSFSITSVQR